MPKENSEQLLKAQSKLTVNLYLLTIAFTIFTFIITLNPLLVKDNIFLSLQLTLSIPLLCSSILARIRLSYAKRPAVWDLYGFLLYLLAYGFLINVVGILLAALVSVTVALVFFGVNILCALLYSTIEIMEDRTKISSRLYKDMFFIAIIFLLGVLPALVFLV